MLGKVCVQCSRALRCVENDVGVIELDDDLKPAALWSADLWECPKCKVQMLLGFGYKPISEAWQEDFHRQCEAYPRRYRFRGRP